MVMENAEQIFQNLAYIRSYSFCKNAWEPYKDAKAVYFTFLGSICTLLKPMVNKVNDEAAKIVEELSIK